MFSMPPQPYSLFRFGGDGWPDMTHARSGDGHVAEKDSAKFWGTILTRHLQYRGKNCPDGTGGFADVACADARYGKEGRPYFEEREGRSEVLTRTTARESPVQDAVRTAAVSVNDLPVEEIDLMQHYQLNPKQVDFGRWLATRLRSGWVPHHLFPRPALGLAQ